MKEREREKKQERQRKREISFPKCDFMCDKSHIIGLFTCNREKFMAAEKRYIGINQYNIEGDIRIKNLLFAEET